MNRESGICVFLKHRKCAGIGEVRDMPDRSLKKRAALLAVRVRYGIILVQQDAYEEVRIR